MTPEPIPTDLGSRRCRGLLERNTSPRRRTDRGFGGHGSTTPSTPTSLLLQETRVGLTPRLLSLGLRTWDLEPVTMGTPVFSTSRDQCPTSQRNDPRYTCSSRPGHTPTGDQDYPSVSRGSRRGSDAPSDRPSRRPEVSPQVLLFHDRWSPTHSHGRFSPTPYGVAPRRSSRSRPNGRSTVGSRTPVVPYRVRFSVVGVGSPGTGLGHSDSRSGPFLFCFLPYFSETCHLKKFFPDFSETLHLKFLYTHSFFPSLFFPPRRWTPPWAQSY